MKKNLPSFTGKQSWFLLLLLAATLFACNGGTDKQRSTIAKSKDSLPFLGIPEAKPNTTKFDDYIVSKADSEKTMPGDSSSTQTALLAEKQKMELFLDAELKKTGLSHPIFIFFETGGYRLTEKADKTLVKVKDFFYTQEISEWVKNGVLFISVNAYTSGKGKNHTNQKLSEDRRSETIRLLEERIALLRGKIHVGAALGESFAVDDVDDPNWDKAEIICTIKL